MKYKIWTFTLLTSIVLSGCGVSNEDWASKDPSAYAVSANTFDISTAWSYFNKGPNTKQMNVNGACSGALIISNTASYHTSATDLYNATNFNGLYEFCKAPYGYKNGTINYTTSNYYKSVGDKIENYWYYYLATSNAWRETAQFPASAKVGDAGLIGVIDNFANSDMTTKIGLEEWSYVIEANTATTVVLNLTVKAFDTTTSVNGTDYLSAPVLQTEQFRYVVTPSNRMTLRSYDFEQLDGFKISAY